MNSRILMILAGLALIAILAPAAGAVAPLWTYPAPSGDDFTMLQVAADGSAVVAGSEKITYLDRNGTKRWAGWSATSMDISRNGRYIVSSQAQTVRLFAASGVMVWEHSILVPVTEVSISPDGTLVAAASSGSVHTFSVSGEGIGGNQTPGVHHIRVSPANDQIIVTTAQDVRRVNLSVVPKWSNENSSVDLVEVAGDGSTFVTSTFNRAWMYHASGALFWEQIVPGGNALALAYSRDGSTIVLGRDDNTVRVLDRNGTLLWTGKARGWVTSVAVSDDGSLIAAGSMDRNLYVYDRAGNLLGTYYANAPIKSHSVGVSGDGSLIAAADMTAVYGFSRQQFEPPVVVATTPPVTPVVTTSATPSPPPTATATVPVTTLPTTPRADLPLFVPLLAAAILAAYRHTRFP